MRRERICRKVCRRRRRGKMIWRGRNEEEKEKINE